MIRKAIFWVDLVILDFPAKYETRFKKNHVNGYLHNVSAFCYFIHINEVYFFL